MSNFLKILKSFKFGYDLGSKMDNEIDASGYWATKIFNWLHPDGPRSQGTAIYQYGDTQVTGHGHVPLSDLGSANEGIKKNAESAQSVNQKIDILHGAHDGTDAAPQVAPITPNLLSLQNTQTPTQSILPATTTLQDIGAGLSALTQNVIGQTNTDAPQSSGSSLSQLSQGLSDSTTPSPSGSSFLTNPNQCLSPLPNGNSLQFNQGLQNNSSSNISGSVLNTNGSQLGGCFGIPNNSTPNAGSQTIGSGFGGIIGSGFSGQ